MKPAALKQWAKDIAARTVWAYGPDELIARLQVLQGQQAAFEDRVGGVVAAHHVDSDARGLRDGG